MTVTRAEILEFLNRGSDESKKLRADEVAFLDFAISSVGAFAPRLPSSRPAGNSCLQATKAKAAAPACHIPALRAPARSLATGALPQAGLMYRN